MFHPELFSGEANEWVGRPILTPDGWGLLADINNDWRVDLTDFELLQHYWLNSGTELPADFSRNGAVDIEDFSLLVGDWLDVR